MPPSSNIDALRIFISYSRTDSAAADRFVKELEANGLNVIIDRRDLPFGEEWQAELEDLITSADVVLWLVSPRSVESQWCLWELGEVTRRKKRLLPVTISPVPASNLPQPLGKLQLLPGQGVFQFKHHFDDLLSTINADHAWIKQHTRLADRAHEWLVRERAPTLLLRGPALANAENWKALQPVDEAVSDEVLELILHSQQGASRRQRYWVSGSAVVSIAAIALAAFAYLSQLEAQHQEQVALTNLERAKQGEKQAAASAQRAEENEKRAIKQRELAELAERNAVKSAREASLRERAARALVEVQTRPEEGLWTAIGALKENLSTDTAILPNVHASAWTALNASRLVHVVRTPTTNNFGMTKSIVPSPDGKLLLVATTEFIHVLHPDGRPAAAPIFNSAHEQAGSFFTQSNSAVWRPSGDYFAVATGLDSEHRPSFPSLDLYSASGQFIRNLAKDEKASFTKVRFLDDDRLYAGTTDGRVLLISIDGNVINQSRVQTPGSIAGLDWINDLFIVAEGNSAAQSKSLKVPDWESVRKAEPVDSNAVVIKTVPTSLPPSARCLVRSPEDKLIAVCGSDGIVTLWKAPFSFNQKPLERERVIRGHTGPVNAAAFHPSGQYLATAGDDGEIRIWSNTGTELSAPLRTAGVRSAIKAIAFTDGGKRLVSDCQERNLCYWDVSDIAVPGYSSKHGSDAFEMVRSAQFIKVDPSSNSILEGFNDYDAGWEIRQRVPNGPSRILTSSKTGKLTALGLAHGADKFAYSTIDHIAVSSFTRELWRKQIADGTVTRLTFAHDNTLLALVIEKSSETNPGIADAAKSPAEPRVFGTDGAKETSIALWNAIDGEMTASRKFTDSRGIDAIVGMRGRQESAVVTLDSKGTVQSWSHDLVEMSSFSITEGNNSWDPSLTKTPGLTLSEDGQYILAFRLGRLAILDKELKAKLTNYDEASIVHAAALESASGTIAVARIAKSSTRSINQPLEISLLAKDGRLMWKIPTVIQNSFGRRGLSYFGFKSGRLIAVTESGQSASWPISPAHLIQRAKARLAFYKKQRERLELEKQAYKAYTARNLQKAIALYAKAIELDPIGTGLYVRLGNSLWFTAKSKADYDRAERAYARQIEIRPYRFITRFQRGKFRASIGNFAGAERDFDQAYRSTHLLLPGLPVVADFIPVNRIVSKATYLNTRSAILETLLRRAIVRYMQKDWMGTIADIDRYQETAIHLAAIRQQLLKTNGREEPTPSPSKKVSPLSVVHFDYRGRALFELGLYEEAMRDLLEAERLLRNTDQDYAFDTLNRGTESPEWRANKRAELLRLTSAAARKLGKQPHADQLDDIREQLNIENSSTKTAARRPNIEFAKSRKSVMQQTSRIADASQRVSEPESRWKNHYGEALRLARAKKNKAALAQINKAAGLAKERLDAASDEAGWTERLASSKLVTGYLLERAGQYNAALEAFKGTAALENRGVSSIMENEHLLGKHVMADHEEAMSFYLQSAQRGSYHAMRRIARFYETGRGVNKNLVEARTWYRKAATAGDSWSAVKLGSFLDYGVGGSKDPNKAFEYFRKAADSGNAIATRVIGWHYETARSKTRDIIKAREWYQKAAKMGDILAQAQLGNFYENGKGGEKSWKKALDWYEKAAVKGNEWAAIQAARMYEWGRGVLADPITAAMWRKRVAGPFDTVANTSTK